MQQEFRKGLSGYFWLMVCHAVAVTRKLDQGQQGAEAPAGGSGVCLTSYFPRASPCDLFTWVALGFEMFRQPRGSWTICVAAKGFQRE